MPKCAGSHDQAQGRTSTYYRARSRIEDHLRQDHGLVQLALYATTDIVVSAALGYYLYKSRTRVPRWVVFYTTYSLRSADELDTAYHRSRDMISKLIIMTITTGALCAYVSTLDPAERIESSIHNSECEH